MGGKRVWSYTAGRRGVNSVTVYERATGSQMYIEWRDDRGRHDHTVEKLTGIVVPNGARDVARKIADKVAEAQADKAAARALEDALGFSPNRTLDALLRALHMAREADWSEQYTRDQKRYREFWKERLGEKTRLISVAAADVEQVVAKEARKRKWSDRTKQAYLRYIVDAFYFAEKKLKWITERHNLSAVDFPSPDSESKAYSEDELRKLLPALRETDLRAGGVGEIAYATGRRLNAIRTLKAGAFEVQSGLPLLRFPGATDKARRKGTAVLTDHAASVVARLLEMPAVRASGLLFPAGDLRSDEADRGPIRREDLIRLLHDAEKKAKVKHVKGRAYHGIKRRVASMVKDRRAMAKQSGTTEATLRKVYEQDDLEPKKKMAEFLAQRRGDA